MGQTWLKIEDFFRSVHHSVSRASQQMGVNASPFIITEFSADIAAYTKMEKDGDGKEELLISFPEHLPFEGGACTHSNEKSLSDIHFTIKPTVHMTSLNDDSSSKE